MLDETQPEVTQLVSALFWLLQFPLLYPELLASAYEILHPSPKYCYYKATIPMMLCAIIGSFSFFFPDIHFIAWLFCQCPQ